MFGGSQSFNSQPISHTQTLGGDVSATQQRRGRQEEKQTAVPATIRVIETAVAERGDGELLFFGHEASFVVLVASVEAVSKSHASMDLVLNDATGRIRARHFGAAESPELEAVAPGRYVSVVGNVRTSPELHFAATFIKVLDSADWISHHMAEVAHTKLKLQRGGIEAPTLLPAKTAAVAATAPFLEPNAKDPLVVTKVPGFQANAPAPGSGPMDKAALMAFVSSESAKGPEGVAVGTVCQRFKLWPEAEIRAALRELADNAELFNTVDEDHFALL